MVKRVKPIKQVTTQDIAKYCGLSRQTVSFILNGHGSLFREETVEKVMKAVETLGYRPFLATHAIRSGRYNAIAILQDTFSYRSDFSTDLFKGILHELQLHDMHMVVSECPEDEQLQNGAIPRVVRYIVADGLLVNYHGKVSDQLHKWINHYKIPAIWINTRMEQNVVRPDDQRSFYSLTQRLIQLGHRRILYVENTKDVVYFHYSREDRKAGYSQALTESGLSPLFAFELSPEDKFDFEFFSHLLQTAERPTAIINVAGIKTLHFIELACQILNLKIPQDLSVITLSNQPVELNYRYECIGVPWFTIGVEGVRLLLSKIEHNLSQVPPTLIPLQIIPGDTIAPVPN